MTGWRIGYTLGPKPLIGAINQAAKPFHVEPDIDRPKGRRRGADRDRRDFGAKKC